jgi:formyltetrahydrofolate-dependent phosphoribosylglycinamide formyltransferase
MRIAVFASGGGTNLQALLNHFNGTTDRGGRIMLVISDRSSAGALRRAADAGDMTREIPVKHDSADATDAATDELLRALEEEQIAFIALAGYLRLLPAAVVSRYRNRIVNIHPSLLPCFGGPGMYGLRVHRAVLAAGCRVSGATVHHVTEEYDEGDIIAQWPVPVLPGDTAESLAARVLCVEHMLYPVALEAVLRAGASPPHAVSESDVGLQFQLHTNDTDMMSMMQYLLTR